MDIDECSRYLIYLQISKLIHLFKINKIKLMFDIILTLWSLKIKIIENVNKLNNKIRQRKFKVLNNIFLFQSKHVSK